MMKNHKKLYILLIAFVLIAAGLIWGGSTLWGIFVTQKVVTLEPAPGTTITFGTQNSDTPSIAQEIVKTTTKLSKRLQPDAYLAIFSATGYKSQTEAINLTDNVTIKTPQLAYTDDKLATILNQEKATIHKVISQQQGSAGYIVSVESLYHQADWYAAELTPNDASLDTMKIILKKDGNIWKVAAKPSIVFWIDDYPNIPQDVIRATNKLGFN